MPLRLGPLIFSSSYFSDDRNPSAMRERLEAVVSSQASLNASGGGDVGSGIALKPSCLIIDEVDGALPAAVEILAEAAATPLIQERKRGKKRALVLKRPVICICNDLYVLEPFFFFCMRIPLLNNLEIAKSMRNLRLHRVS